jgi:thymidylate synthase
MKLLSYLKDTHEQLAILIDGFVYDDFEIDNYCSHGTLKGKMAV